MSNDLVVLDNAVVKSAYNLSLNEQRLIYALLMKVPKGKAIDHKEPFYIAREDFIQLGACPTHVTRDIRQATSDLMKKTLFIDTDCGVIEFNWLSEVLRYDKNAEQKLKDKYPNPEDHAKYMRALRICNLIDALPSHRDDDDIIARVKFSERTLPFLTDLKECFTKIMIADVKEFNSVYSYRIYQLIMQFKSTGNVFISLSELRNMLVLNDKYKATKDLRKWVIDTAINEITEKSPYKVAYTLTKKGRKFTHLELKFKLKKEKQNPKHGDDNRDPNTPDLFDDLTDKEREIVANKTAYADSINADDTHRKNLIKKALADDRKLHGATKEQEQKQKSIEQEVHKQAMQKYEQILADDVLINEFISLNVKDPRTLQGIERYYYDHKDYKNLFMTFKSKFENPSILRFIDLSMIKK